ncbi:hypothetical protein BDQ17DRAFT_1438007 [Cyathus striatus]|nr:hypothetical protein BDQ17DRAFT_1438007 [Cyathus striatus]
MSDLQISPKDFAQCQANTVKTANEAAECAMAEVLSQARAKVAAQHAEAKACQAARLAEEEAEACWVAEEEAEEATAARQAEANAVAATLFPETDSPMAPPENPIPSFAALDTSTTPPSPIVDEEHELLEEADPPWLYLSTVATGKCKATPKPPTMFVPASKCCKYFGGVEIITPSDKILPLPEYESFLFIYFIFSDSFVLASTPSVVASELEPSSISGYNLHNCSVASAPASTHSPQVTIMDPSKAKATKTLSKATGTKKTKHTHEEMPQLTSDEPINVGLLQNNLHKLIKHFSACVCINCISHGCTCIFHGFGVKCGACSQVSMSYCSFSIPPPNTEFALSVARCAGESSLFGLNEVCHALNLSHMCAYCTLLAAKLEQVEYTQNCIAVVCHLQDIAYLHSPAHLHTVEGLSEDFMCDTLVNLKEMADELTPWLPNPTTLLALEKALEHSFALHTFNLHATSTPDITGFPSAKETIVIKDFANSLMPCNLGKLGGIFSNSQLYPLSLKDYSSAESGPSSSSLVRATHEGNTEHSVDLSKKD